MTRARSPLQLAVLAALAVSAFAGCIKLPSSVSGHGASGGTNDFGWKGSASLPQPGKVPVATPHLQLTLGDPAGSGLGAWTPPFDVQPRAYDFNGDGSDELVGLANDTKVYVFDGKDGHVLATLPTTVRQGWYIERELNPVAIAVLKPGDPPSIVVADHAAYVAVWQFVPDQSDGQHFTFAKQWERRLTLCNPEPSMDSAPVLADLDGDGTLEVVLQTEEVGIFALKADGSSLWRQCWAGGNAEPVVADLENDGHPEAIFAADDGYVAVLDGAKGTVKWTFNTDSLGISPASISVGPTVADLDGHLPKEIIYTARDAPQSDPAHYKDDHMAIVAVHADASTNWEGKALWWREPTWANPLSYTHLVVTDADGDGSPDIFGMDWNTIGHFPGNWERLGPAHAFRLDAQGNDVWVKEIDTWWSNKDILVADANGDGALDVLANGPYGGNDGFYVLSAGDGNMTAFLPMGGWKVMRGPQLLDLQHDGRPKLVAPVIPVDPKDYRGAFLVVDLGLRATPATGAA